MVRCRPLEISDRRSVDTADLAMYRHRCSSFLRSCTLKPTLDLRSIFKGVLADHLDIDSAFLDRKVFPDSGSTAVMDDLIRET